MPKPKDLVISALRGPAVCFHCLVAKTGLKGYEIASELQVIARAMKFHSVAAICNLCGVLAPIFHVVD
jgi:hypothetical protein